MVLPLLFQAASYLRLQVVLQLLGSDVPYDYETRFCQYLGRISYMFYLVHGPILTTLGDRLYAATGMSRDGHAIGVPAWTNRLPLPRNGPFGLEIAYLMPHFILLPFTLWVAEVTTPDRRSQRNCSAGGCIK